MREKQIKELKDLIVKRESNKAKLLIKESLKKIKNPRYAYAHTAVLICCVREELQKELPAFYTEEDSFLEMLFPQEGVASFNCAIDELCNAVKGCETENKEKVFLKAVEYINENLTDYNLSVSDAAQYVGVAPAVLSKLFAVKMGITPARYIAQKRVEKSLDELKKDGASVEKIALKTGFASAETYIRVFKSFYDIPPGKWNKLFLSKNRRS